MLKQFIKYAVIEDAHDNKTDAFYYDNRLGLKIPIEELHPAYLNINSDKFRAVKKIIFAEKLEGYNDRKIMFTVHLESADGTVDNCLVLYDEATDIFDTGFYDPSQIIPYLLTNELLKPCFKEVGHIFYNDITIDYKANGYGDSTTHEANYDSINFDDPAYYEYYNPERRATKLPKKDASHMAINFEDYANLFQTPPVSIADEMNMHKRAVKFAPVKPVRNLRKLNSLDDEFNIAYEDTSENEEDEEDEEDIYGHITVDDISDSDDDLKKLCSRLDKYEREGWTLTPTPDPKEDSPDEDEEEKKIMAMLEDFDPKCVPTIQPREDNVYVDYLEIDLTNISIYVRPYTLVYQLEKNIKQNPIIRKTTKWAYNSILYSKIAIGWVYQLMPYV